MFDITIFLPFLLAFAATFLLTPISIVIIKKMQIMDDPKKHKHPAILHTKPIPRGGGIPLLAGILIASFFTLTQTPITAAIFIAATIALIIGVLDDKLDVSPYLRFFGNFIVAGIVVGSGVTISFITNPLGGILHLDTIGIALPFLGANEGIYLSDILAIFWIVWVMNMLNWSNGVDGQMPGIIAISSVIIGLLSLRFAVADSSTLLAAHLSFIIAGASFGFLYYNFHPAKIFLGYGATSVYLLLAVVSILSGAKLATAILVLGVPMVDGAFTILRRIFSGRSPFWHDKKHLHHLLLEVGLSQRLIALCYWTVSAILGTIALTLSSQGKLFAIVMLIVILGGAILSLHLFLQARDEKNSL